ncbi:pentapeptide repeat-containing protein [Magnetospirillum sp. UT-4]|uniref:pentapeptide repeat-containing protein n=1 Tax=Magnetospirillum sp. UT-4 TaxID=2681467 RepID=UPI00137FBBE9|nr:pentapeptide repeat-containing protein [Magnetospirillum sp. UT-4]CAA7622285.1 conserved hypothetical protein [Magnetospirillum sp. UT-4]
MRPDMKGADLAAMKGGGGASPPAVLRKSDLSGINLNGAHLTGLDLDEVNLSGASLRSAMAAGVSFVGANLAGADLSGANLSGAQLGAARLLGANLTRANLTQADLSGANLSGADLTDAITAGANFHGASLRGAILNLRPPVEEAPPRAPPEPQTVPTPPTKGSLSEQSIKQLPEVEPGVRFKAQDEFTPPVTLDEAMAQIPGKVAGAKPPPASARAMHGASAPVAADGGHFTYRTQNLAILLLSSDQIGMTPEANPRRLLNLFSQFNRTILGAGRPVTMAARGRYVVGGFENPSDALRCARAYITILQDMNVTSFACVNWGSATVRVNMNGNIPDQIILDSVSPSARMRPLGLAGELLILEELYANPATNHDQFRFEKIRRKWVMSAAQGGPDMEVDCYRVHDLTQNMPGGRRV